MSERKWVNGCRRKWSLGRLGVNGETLGSDGEEIAVNIEVFEERFVMGMKM